MFSLTSRQVSIIIILADAGKPITTAEIAARLNLSTRQVNYALKAMQKSLEDSGGGTIRITPGVGASLEGPMENWLSLMEELNARERVKTVLTTEQRRQLLALRLLDADDPLIYTALKSAAQVSRQTIIHDLDYLESWFSGRRLVLRRRPNFGVFLAGSEFDRRQALAGLLWGSPELGEPVFRLSFRDGLTLQTPGDQLRLLQRARQLVESLDVLAGMRLVADIEAHIGGRFVDDAVLYLALTLALQARRARQGRLLEIPSETVEWLRSLQVWETAAAAAAELLPADVVEQCDAEIAGIAIQILTAPRNDRWPQDLEVDPSFKALIDRLMAHISGEYGLPQLAADSTLRDGLFVLLIPACLRQRFGVDSPLVHPAGEPEEDFPQERKLAEDLAGIIAAETGLQLPESELDGLVYLLHAAWIRERPFYLENVIAVCPSGMATVQLMVARLKARFPHLGRLQVVSMRQLTPEMIAKAQLVVTTVPLPEYGDGDGKIIEVHPLLLPEDVERITHFLAYPPERR